MLKVGIVLVALGSSSAMAEKDPCGAAALKLGTAKLVATPYKAPDKCTYKGASEATITSDADAKAAFGCDGKALGVDWKQAALVARLVSFSPAQTGFLTFDDGKRVTFVSRFRTPCPKDPRPMPGPSTPFIVKILAGARTFGHASCTVASKC
ncbi:MAG: hypothetical protein ABI867_24225 [Kofleriaceae bacterium]